MTPEQKKELMEANKKILISGLAATFLIIRLAQEQVIELTDEVVQYLKKDKSV